MASSHSSDARLRELEREIARQREVIDRIAARVGAQDDALCSLQASVAVMIASWHSDIGVALSRLAEQIVSLERSFDETPASRRRPNASQKEGAGERDLSGQSTAALESRIALLAGLGLSSAEIARALEMPERSLRKYYGRLRETNGTLPEMRIGAS